MYYVYILQSVDKPDKFYVGYTEDVRARLIKHNEGGSKYTSKYNPWTIKNAISFNAKEKALHLKNTSRATQAELLQRSISDDQALHIKIFRLRY